MVVNVKKVVLMTDSEKFEQLKKKVDSLKVRKMAAEAEVKRLSDELDRRKAEIKEVYGVEITDFANAIEVMKGERKQKMDELERLVREAEEKIGGER